MAAPCEMSTQDEGAKLIANSRPRGAAGGKWIISKAKSMRKDDIFTAKSLFLTAKALYPSDFSVQFEAYLLEKAEKNKKEASTLLMDLFHHFQTETELQAELCGIAAALQQPLQDGNKFLKGVFELLPDSVQKEVLVFCADKTEDKHSKCQLQLLLMKKFPELVDLHGVTLVETLLEFDKVECNKQPLNIYRHLLVTEVLPVILSCENLDILPKQRTKWFHLAMEFYINISLRPKSSSDVTHKAGLMSPVMLKSPDKKLDHDEIFSRVSPHYNIPPITNPWEKLHQLLDLVSKRNKWDSACLASLSMGFQQRMTFLLDMLRQGQIESPEVNKPVLFSLVVLFFQSALAYMSKLNPGVLRGCQETSGVTHVGHFLLEDVDSRKRARKHKHKKRKIEGDKEIQADHDSNEDSSQGTQPALNFSQALGFGDEVVEAFTTASNSWQTLTTEAAFEKDFLWMLNRWKCDQWLWLRIFKIDHNLYKGDYAAALQLIQDEIKWSSGDQSGDQTSRAKYKLQLYIQQASCQFNLGQYTPAAESVLEAIPLIDEQRGQGSTFKSIREKTPVPKYNRLINVIPCKAELLLLYCVQLMFVGFKKKVLHYADASDEALGHMIVMMQYDWPKEENTFFEVLKRLKKVGNFSYPVFFIYVINIDILEEFAYIKTDDGGKIKLDLFPPCITIQRQQRTITRGVTRGGKEDFRTAIEKQVSRCEENVSELLLKFLACEKDSLIQCLNAHNAQC